MSRDVRRGDASRVSRRARRRRPTRTCWRPGEARSEGRWRARRREAGVRETRSEVGRERARRSKIDRRVARRSGGETRPNRARLRACRPRRARSDQPPAKNRGSIALLLPRVFLPIPPPAATVASLSGRPRAASRARERGIPIVRCVPPRAAPRLGAIHVATIDQRRAPSKRAKSDVPDPSN